MYHRLVPGECLVFNNRRMVHGRRAFVPNGGQRHYNVRSMFMSECHMTILLLLLLLLLGFLCAHRLSSESINGTVKEIGEKGSFNKHFYVFMLLIFFLI